MTPLVSVIICTHQPDPERLRRTLLGLRAQTLSHDTWETLLIDNASHPPVDISRINTGDRPELRVLRESRLGLSHARRHGLEAARAAYCVFVDDDNVLAPDYLELVVRLFAAHPPIAALGGRSVPEFERAPEAWHAEFFDLLALRDLGPDVKISSNLRPPGAPHNEYPAFAPIGAGMALRRAQAIDAITEVLRLDLTDRRGSKLASGGDNALIFALMIRGSHVGYFPELALTHLIPATRLEAQYLARLNRGIQRSWTQLLAHFNASPWPPIAAWTLPLRRAKAWWKYRAWTNAPAFIRWQGACGHFEGRVARFLS